VRAVFDVRTGRPGLTEERAEELDGAPTRAGTGSDTEADPQPTTTTVVRGADPDDTPTTRFRVTTTTRAFTDEEDIEEPQ
jgi:hypothetical protein